jgi:hypothetical protein
MLDSEAISSYYHQNGIMASTQMQQDTIPAMDTSAYFSDQGPMYRLLDLLLANVIQFCVKPTLLL